MIDIFEFTNNPDLDKKTGALVTIAKLKEMKDEIMKV